MKASPTLAMLRAMMDRDEAATATEYAVMLALIIVVSIATIGVFGQSVATSVFGSVNALFGS